MACFLYIVGCLAASHWSPVAPPLCCDNQKSLQTLPSIPWRAKSPLVENHCCKRLHSPQPHEVWSREGAIIPAERWMPDRPNSRLSTTWQFLPIVSYLIPCIFPFHSALPRITSSLGSPNRVKPIGPVL